MTTWYLLRGGALNGHGDRPAGIQREDNVTWSEEILEDRIAICKHLTGINSKGAMRCPCCSIPRARPLLAALDSTSGLPITGPLWILHPGSAHFWPSPASVSSSIECDQYSGLLLNGMGHAKVLSTTGGHSRPSKGLVAFLSLSQYSPAAQQASSANGERRIQKGSQWGGFQLFIKQANMFPPRKF